MHLVGYLYEERDICAHMQRHKHFCGMKSKLTLTVRDKKCCTISLSDLNLWTFITFLRGQNTQPQDLLLTYDK
jgi:hypothetical protein